MLPLMIMSVLALLLAATFIRTYTKARSGECFANSLLANTTAYGRATRLGDAAFTQRYLIGKAGSDAAHMAICTATDKPLGVVPDMTPTTDVDFSYPLPLNYLGLNQDTERVIATAAIAVDDMLSPAAAGLVQTTPIHGGGTIYVIGKAVTAASASGDQVEMIPCFPYLVIVPA